MTGASRSGRTEVEHGRFAAKQGSRAWRGTRACHVETGSIRPQRGAARGLEVNGRRFRTAARPREVRHGLDIDTEKERQAVVTNCLILRTCFDSSTSEPSTSKRPPT